MILSKQIYWFNVLKIRNNMSLSLPKYYDGQLVIAKVYESTHNQDKNKVIKIQKLYKFFSLEKQWIYSYIDERGVICFLWESTIIAPATELAKTLYL